MAATSDPENACGALIGSYDQAAARIRELNERLIERAIAEGSRTLDAYERALAGLVEFTAEAGITQLEWLSALVQAHAEFVRDVSTTYTATVRLLLG
jgi:hypothetical protein